MATSGVSVFDLDMNSLVEEAFERCGVELRTGYDLRTATRSLNLLTVEWSNRGINLWTVEEGQIPMNTGQSTYPLPVDTIDLLSQVIRTGTLQNQIDINISRISEDTYSTIPNKLAVGRPVQVWINRQSGNINPTAYTLVGNGTVSGISATDTTIQLSPSDMTGLAATGYVKIDNEIIYYPNVSTTAPQLLNCYRGQAGTTAAAHSASAAILVPQLPCVNVWPTPNSPGSQYTFVYWRLRRIQDAGTGVTTNDIPFRFIQALVAGLAYYMSMKIQGVDPNRIQMLKADYMEQWTLASDEDREKAPVRFVPRSSFYTGGRR